MRTNSWVIIADDLTGAADAAVGFAAHAEPVVVVDCDADWPDSAVVSVTTESRHASPDVARRRAERVAGRALAVPGAHIYKKVDSLGRGNIAAEVAGALAAARVLDASAIAILAPAFPALDRRVVGGRIVVGGVASADLAALLEAGDLRVAVIGQQAYRNAAELVERCAALRGQTDAVVIDASTDDDLRLVAHAIELMDAWGLPVGSGGLAAELGRINRADSVQASSPRLDRRGILFVVGSHAEVARAQLESLTVAGLHHLELDHERLAANPHPEALRSALRTGNAVVSPSLLAAVEEHRADEVAGALARVVAEAFPDVTLLVVSGGHTARAILGRLGVPSFRVLGEVQPGMILSELPGRPQRLITKSGSFGGADALVSLIPT